MEPDWACEVCGEMSGETDDEMTVDFWDAEAPEGEQHKMAHVQCAETKGWSRA